MGSRGVGALLIDPHEAPRPLKSQSTTTTRARSPEIGVETRAPGVDAETTDRQTRTGTPQGEILSPLLANVALSVVDEHFAAKRAALGPSWTRVKHLREGGAVMKSVRYADDFVILVRGSCTAAEALFDEVAEVLAPMGLRLSVEKTHLTHAIPATLRVGSSQRISPRSSARL